MGIRDELENIEEKARKEKEELESQRLEAEKEKKQREEEEKRLKEEAQQRAERRIQAEKKKRAEEEKKQRVISIINDPNPTLDEPHVYSLRGKFSMDICLDESLNGPYPFIGTIRSEKITGEEIRVMRIVMTEREFLISKELGSLKKVFSESASTRESGTEATLNKTSRYSVVRSVYSNYQLKEIDYTTCLIEQNPNFSEQEKLEVLRKKIEYVKGLSETEKKKTAKLKLNDESEICITDERAVLCSLSINQEYFMLSEEIEREREAEKQRQEFAKQRREKEQKYRKEKEERKKIHLKNILWMI